MQNQRFLIIFVMISKQVLIPKTDTVELTALHLQRCGIRPSYQRVAIMKYLVEHMTHPTVDTIFRELQKTMPSLSRTTVYNTLELFRSRGAIKELGIDGRNARYDALLEEHAHFRCRQCGKIIDIQLPQNVKESIHSLPKLTVEQTELNFIGLCNECEAELLGEDKLT